MRRSMLDRSPDFAASGTWLAPSTTAITGMARQKDMESPLRAWARTLPQDERKPQANHVRVLRVSFAGYSHQAENASPVATPEEGGRAFKNNGFTPAK